MTLNPTSSWYNGAPGAPYKPASGEVVVIVNDAAGDPVYDFDDDSSRHEFEGDMSVGGGVTADTLDSNGAISGVLITGTDLALNGLTGAVAGGRYVGFTATVAPTTGDFLVGDVVVSLNGSAWVCTVSGEPGTWVGLQSVLLAPLAAPTFTGHVTIPQGTAVLDAAALNQVTSALTITSGTLPNLGAWVSGTAKQNPVTRQITAVVEVVTAGTATTAACTIAISPDNSTFTTVGTPGVSTAVNTIGAQTLVTSVTIPAAWWIKLTFSNCTVAASVYY